MPVLAVPLLELRLAGSYCQITWLLLGSDGCYCGHVVVYLDYQATWMETVLLPDLNILDFPLYYPISWFQFPSCCKVTFGCYMCFRCATYKCIS